MGSKQITGRLPLPSQIKCLSISAYLSLSFLSFCHGLSLCRSFYLSVCHCLSVALFIILSLSVCCLSVYVSICLTVYVCLFTVSSPFKVTLIHLFLFSNFTGILYKSFTHWSHAHCSIGWVTLIFYLIIFTVWTTQRFKITGDKVKCVVCCAWVTSV